MIGDHFAQGRAKFVDHSGPIESTAKVYVRVLLGDHPDGYLAQLDTGAAWSVLGSEAAKDLGFINRIGERVVLSSRFGTYWGHLVRLPVTFVADEGESLETDGTFFVSADWPSPVTFLGYSGLLDSIRFALDPQANHFYFGS
jgi:hypothetical protein